MNESDKNDFTEIMMGLGELYGKEVTKPLLRIYFTALQNMTIQEFSQAASLHTQSIEKAGTFFPKPADIIRALTGSIEKQAQEVEDKAEMAWACVVGEISRIGHTSPLQIEDRQAMAAVKALGGWMSLCMSSNNELTWKKKEFMKVYETYERIPVDQLPHQLPGINEIQQHKQNAKKDLNGLLAKIEERRQMLGVSHDTEK